MKLRLLSVISLTALVGLASTGANAQRGLITGPSADRPASSPDAEVAQRNTSPEPGETFRDCADCPELVVVPPGDFTMGSNDTPYEKPEHAITIRKPFAIGRREVTFAEWDQCADAGACKHRPDDHGWGRGDRPVINVSWDDSKLFVGWLSQKVGQRYRLPTEAEWEYAARAGTADQFAGAKVANSLARRSPSDDWAWYNVEKTQPVANKKPNAWGLYDMRGNVAEWVQDWYDSKYYAKSPMADPKGPDSSDGGRGVRGGTFHDDGPWLTRVSLRMHFPEDYRHFDLGFRLVREKH
jgi:formylglycine-generating enzyme required for sulfatase activity